MNREIDEKAKCSTCIVKHTAHELMLIGYNRSYYENLYETTSNKAE